MAEDNNNGKSGKGKTKDRGAANASSKKNKGARASEDNLIETGVEIEEDIPVPDLPAELPVLPTTNIIVFPDMVAPLSISNDREMRLIDRVLLDNRMLIIAPLQREMKNASDLDAIHRVGCVSVVLKMLKLPDGEMRILLQGLHRVKLPEFTQADPDLTAKLEVIDDVIPKTVEMKALHGSLRKEFRRLTELLQFPDEIKVAAHNINHAGHFADLVASNLDITHDERMAALDETNVMRRMEKLAVQLARNIQIVELGTRIQEDVRQKIGDGQREYFLREQLKSIRKELGEDDGSVEMEEIKKKINEAGMSEEGLKESKREFSRLEKMQAGSAEYTVSMTYLDWMTTLPWQQTTKDNINIRKARQILDEDHYELKKVKERIVEFLAVRKINPEGKSPILCLVGPPGVGKTSLGKSIARAMGRKFVRHSLGGVRDEAEIRGHRRTYIGALPGRIIQGLRRAESKNPVFMLDEIDKLGNDFRGDPSSALLEALDPEQNNEFRDQYLDVAFDLSQVIFIATANTTETIPDALFDRMEVITLPGYSTVEKHEIAMRYLLPRVLKEHGMPDGRVRFTKASLDFIMRGYTREAGLRNLEREIATVVRKIAVKMATGSKERFNVTPELVKKLLGPVRFHNEIVSRANVPGVSVGLVWTAVGGDILFIESTKMPGSKNLFLTGSLGDVIKESAQAAMSWIRSHNLRLGIADDFYDNSDIHIHFPEGAIPKDGPSAGVALVASLVSLLINKRIKPQLAMTGEITLRGKVLPVGGIKEKMIGAHLAGIREVILPHANLNDLIDLPKEVREGITFHPIKDIVSMLPLAFPDFFALVGGVPRPAIPAPASKKTAGVADAELPASSPKKRPKPKSTR